MVKELVPNYTFSQVSLMVLKGSYCMGRVEPKFDPSMQSTIVVGLG
jgi:hypothetical protein